jgi:hypothetical protein
MAEYAVVIAGIAAVCVVAALFLGSLIGDRVHNVKPAAPLEPPHTTPHLIWPTKLEECEDGGWRNYAQFSSERGCEDYVRAIAP